MAQPYLLLGVVSAPSAQTIERPDGLFVSVCALVAPGKNWRVEARDIKRCESITKKLEDVYHDRHHRTVTNVKPAEYERVYSAFLSLDPHKEIVRDVSRYALRSKIRVFNERTAQEHIQLLVPALFYHLIKMDYRIRPSEEDQMRALAALDFPPPSGRKYPR
jgi:hypothetical protein